MDDGAKHIDDYLAAIRTQLATGKAREHAYRPALERLLTDLSTGLTATNDPSREKCGAPDFIVQRGQVPVGYLECKDIGVSLSKTLKTKQLQSYLESLGSLILTDYLEFRWFVAGEERLSATIATIDAKGQLRKNPKGIVQLLDLLGAFFTTESPSIRTPKQLAHRMARLADLMRNIIARTFDAESDTGPLHEQFEGFRDVLLHDLTSERFADMYAQTICYGLFAAIVHSDKKTEFTREHAAYDLPATNPFLREMFSHIAGPGLDPRIVWVVDDLAELLRVTDIDAILEDFGKATRRDDPVVHFYETFLAHYDPKMREARGVYYTPEPVVSYIVRSIDHILKTDFALPEGLADTSKVPCPFLDGDGKHTTRDVHKVQILDPATGTGTFLHGVIGQIHERFAGNAGLWDGYVRDHLLPRLHGFELLMAPYAVAHMKLGLQLEQTGYTFGSDERLNVFLTNTLEEAEHHAAGLFASLIAKEANGASRVKRETPVMVILGNPPYSGHSENKGEWIKKLIDDYKQVDGKPLGERNPKYLNDDYVKFIRFAQHRIEQTGHGVLAFISNHGYLDNPTFRGMRQNLMQTFDDIYIVDLHGNSKKKETCPDGSKDENVFDIQQGVAIGIFVRKPKPSKKPAKVHHLDLFGLRKNKYDWLNENDVASTGWQALKPETPQYLLVPRDKCKGEEFDLGFLISSVFPESSSGVKTHRDHFAIAFSEEEMASRIDAFCDTDDLSAFCELHKLKSTRDWDVESAQMTIRELKDIYTPIMPCAYRPFDLRMCYYGEYLMDWPREEIMRHMLAGENLGLILGRQGQVIGDNEWNIVSCCTCLPETNFYRRGGNSVFPLYLYPDVEGGKGKLFSDGAGEWEPGPDGRVPNLSREFVDEFASKLGLEFVSDGLGDLKTTFGPEDIFHYAYAIFHSPTYRERYAEFLKIDFPRLPLTSDAALFGALCALGAELVGLHLLEVVPAPKVNYPVTGDSTVDKPRYVDTQQRVYINDEQFFEPVPPEVWEFHVGGYQVCAKWLKDRKGRQLSYDDITHYRQVVTALGETIRLMSDIDAAIPTWPVK